MRKENFIVTCSWEILQFEYLPCYLIQVTKMNAINNKA
jgi:hypothetical protein